MAFFERSSSHVVALLDRLFANLARCVLAVRRDNRGNKQEPLDVSVRESVVRTAERIEAERTRLRAALGEMTAGGMLENVEPVGAASLWHAHSPEADAAPLDLALAIHPFPLTGAAQRALEEVGYVLTLETAAGPVQRFTHSGKAVQLLICESGSDAWTDLLLVRDYIRQNPTARAEYLQRRTAWDAGAKADFFRETSAAAHAWYISRIGFAPVTAAAQELQDLRVPWRVASGWALDLFLGRVTRVHHDVDVEIARDDQLALYEYMTTRGWKFVTPYNQRLEPWLPRMRLELPRHQAHAHRDGAFLDFLLIDIAHDVWHYRRDSTVIRALDKVGLTNADGIPYLAPELALLFKSRNTSTKLRPQDETDFMTVSRHLEPERRAWLRWALTVTDPSHPWLDQLG